MAHSTIVLKAPKEMLYKPGYRCPSMNLEFFIPLHSFCCVTRTYDEVFYNTFAPTKDYCSKTTNP